MGLKRKYIVLDKDAFLNNETLAGFFSFYWKKENSIPKCICNDKGVMVMSMNNIAKLSINNGDVIEFDVSGTHSFEFYQVLNNMSVHSLIEVKETNKKIELVVKIMNPTYLNAYYNVMDHIVEETRSEACLVLENKIARLNIERELKGLNLKENDMTTLCVEEGDTETCAKRVLANLEGVIEIV